jgi:hypothetical protein
VVEDFGGRWQSAVAVGFQWVSGEGKGLRRCGSARRSSGRCSFILKIDGVSESAWQHRRRRSEFDGDGASARMGVCRCVSGVERRKRARQGSASALVGEREGEGAPAGEAAAINGHEGLRPSMPSRGRTLDEGKRKEFKKRGGSGASVSIQEED